MGRPFGTSFFGGLSSRLARVLGLNGAVDPQVDIDAKTVILGLDASGIGYNDGFGGRQWTLRANQTGGVAPPTLGIRAQVDVLIEGISMTLRNPSASDGIIVRIYGSQDAMAVEPTTPGSNSSFFERCLTVGEKPPILLAASNAVPSSGGVFLTSVTTTSAISTIDQNMSPYLEFAVPLLLGAGCGMVFSGANANSQINVSIVGRVLPGAFITQ